MGRPHLAKSVDGIIETGRLLIESKAAVDHGQGGR
jgi:hypothetical protein